MKRESKLIFKHKDIIQVKSLIYKSVVIALVREIRSARVGVNKVQVKNTAR